MRFGRIALLVVAAGASAVVSSQQARADSFSWTFDEANSAIVGFGFNCAVTSCGTVTVSGSGTNWEITGTLTASFTDVNGNVHSLAWLDPVPVPTLAFTLPNSGTITGITTVSPATNTFVAINAQSNGPFGPFMNGIDCQAGAGNGCIPIPTTNFVVDITTSASIASAQAFAVANSGGNFFQGDVGEYVTCKAGNRDCTTGLVGGNTGFIASNAAAVPGPIVGAGLPGLLAACASLVAFARRRRKRFA